MQKIVILGATGGCVDVLDTILDINAALSEAAYEVIGFLDDRKDLENTRVLGVPVIGPFAAATELTDCAFVTGIGSPYNYWRREEIIKALGIPFERFATIVHPTAAISSSAELGFGTVIHQHAVITTGALIGNHVLILPQVVISHGATVGDFTIVNSGACLAGEVKVGRCCYLGARSAVRQETVLGDACQVGIGAVVLKDVAPKTVVVGNPARILRRIEN